MLADCERQVRASFGGAFGLDFGAVFALAEARGLTDRALLADLLPDVERLVVALYHPDQVGGSEHGD